MKLNTLSPSLGSKHSKKRLGRGIGSGVGKTCGKGHKGQKARAGGYHKVGFEGGQMPMQRRLPKFGFKSRVGLVTEQLRTSTLNKLDESLCKEITLDTLINANLIKKSTLFVKIIANGEVTKAINVKGLRVSAGAKAQIEAAGGKVE